ncbi:MAG: hypothetical protein WC599_14445 [Bacteroidales bacterium]
MFETDTIIKSFAIPIVVAFFTALITAFITFKQFRKGHIWQLKVEKYDDIFSALFALSQFYRNRLQEIDSGEETDEEIIDDYNDAIYHLGEVVFKGEFIIRKDAVKILNKLLVQLEKQEPGFLKDTFTTDTKEKYCQTQYTELHHTLKEIRLIAKKDLKVTK